MNCFQVLASKLFGWNYAIIECTNGVEILFNLRRLLKIGEDTFIRVNGELFKCLPDENIVGSNGTWKQVTKIK